MVVCHSDNQWGLDDEIAYARDWPSRYAAFPSADVDALRGIAERCGPDVRLHGFGTADPHECLQVDYFSTDSTQWARPYLWNEFQTWNRITQDWEIEQLEDVPDSALNYIMLTQMEHFYQFEQDVTAVWSANES